jgi:hypothetical protein
MEKKFEIQVPKEHYYGDYENVKKFISYYYQIELIRNLKVQTILEIGVGNKTVSNFLKQNHFNISTCDFDKELEPDYVADIRHLEFSDNSYELITAFQILEHLPWEDFEKALLELHRVSKKYVIISIPYSSLGFELIINVPFIARFFNKSYLDFFFRIPYFFRTLKFSGMHYWEMGRKNYPKSKIKSVIKKHFNIISELRPIINHYHYFFVLEKK